MAQSKHTFKHTMRQDAAASVCLFSPQDDPIHRVEKLQCRTTSSFSSIAAEQSPPATMGSTSFVVNLASAWVDEWI